MTLDDARSKFEDGPRYYNKEISLSGINQMTLILLQNPGEASRPS